jgi:hypothetical protein
MRTARATASAILICLSLLAAPLAFGENTQQDKMKTCNADATSKHLSGDARKEFMQTCLSNDTAASGKEMTPQQQKMSACSKDAAAQHLSGDERKKFMSTCLSK